MIFVTEKRMADKILSLEEKAARLTARLKELGCAVVAFSGGADSALLAYCAKRAMGGGALAVTIWSPLLAERDREEIFSFTGRYNIPLLRIRFDETGDSEFRRNKPDRCYRCKSMRLELLERCARERNIPWVLDGSNVSDLSDYRPGMRALQESDSAVSPLLECGFTKEDVRALSRLHGLPTAEKPAAACLASRIPTNTHINKETLSLIDRGEEIVRAFLPENAQVRLRRLGEKAKIETDREYIPGLSADLGVIREKLSALGFDGVSIADEGYQMGGATAQSK